MPTPLQIPTPLRPYTSGLGSVDLDGETVGEVLADLTNRYPGLREPLYTEDGRLRRFVNVYVNDEDIRYLQREATPLKPGDTLTLVPAMAGG